MKSLITLALVATVVVAPAYARDTVVNVRLSDVLDMPEVKTKLDGSVKFFLAGQATPKVLKKFGEDVSNLKTNAVGKSDEVSCKWVTLSTLMSLQKSAKEAGANAVVGITSYYKKNETTSDTTVECHAGAMMSGVALKGTYATVQE
jgi:uncharacterized protein YbjQ (UPF0145 family)